MRVLQSLLLGLALLSCSCGINNRGIIKEEKMVDVLADIHIADAILTVANLKMTTDTNAIQLYYADVLKKHQITQKQFEKSLKYYTSKPKEFEKIYEKVSEKLAKMEGEFEQKSAQEKEKLKKEIIKKDSLENDSIKQDPSDYE